MKLKLEMSMKILAMIEFSNYSIKSKDYDNWNKLVVGKMKGETVGVVIEEFFRLKPKMYSHLVDEHKKRKRCE